MYIKEDSSSLGSIRGGRSPNIKRVTIADPFRDSTEVENRRSGGFIRLSS